MHTHTHRPPLGGAGYMPRGARAWIALVIAAGLGVSLHAALDWHSDSLWRFLPMLLLAIPVAAIKARLPGMTGTYSGSFIFILAAIPALTMSEMVAIAGTTALVQCFWHSRNKPQPVQLLFNIANLIVSTALAHAAFVRLRSRAPEQPEELLLGVATLIYWTVNTGLLSVVLTLVGEGMFVELWRRWIRFSLPFHLAGGVIAGLISKPVEQGDWRAVLLFVPVVLLVAIYYRLFVDKVAPAALD